MKFLRYHASIYADQYDQEVGTCISVYIENGILFVVKADWGGIAYDYSSDGEVESFVFFDLENTNKLARDFRARKDEDLVKKMAEYFGRYKRAAKYEICAYCDKRGIDYKTHVHY
ncbi:MAG: hypothetical protein KH111_06935 [Bacteroidales bacterium]|nr:hypothetical protein [Bacteroidales bacterium]